jgi:hypothetical protein
MRTVFALLCVLVSVAAADDMQIGDKTLKNAKVVRAEPDCIVISHSAGVSTYELAELPEALQKQYGYDPTPAAPPASPPDGMLGLKHGFTFPPRLFGWFDLQFVASEEQTDSYRYGLWAGGFGMCVVLILIAKSFVGDRR